MAKEKVAAKKIRRKIWVELLAPDIFNNEFIGETHVYEPEDAVGKTVTVNLMSLTNDPKRQFAEVQFEVAGLKDGKGVARLKSYAMTASAVKKLFRKKKHKIADSCIFITADAKSMRLKYFIMSRIPASASIRAELRNEAKAFLSKSIRKVTFETLMNDVVSFKFKNFVKDGMSQLFPIHSFEIKYAGLESAKKGEKAYEQVAESGYARIEKKEPAIPKKQLKWEEGSSEEADKAEADKAEETDKENNESKKMPTGEQEVSKEGEDNNQADN